MKRKLNKKNKQPSGLETTMMLRVREVMEKCKDLGKYK